MSNILDEINVKLDRLLEQQSVSTSVSPGIEIVNRTVLCQRLNITEPTAIRWEKKKKIPAIRFGSIVRYNWPAVIEALTNKKPR